MRRYSRVGTAARARIRQGGVVAKGRRAATLDEWQDLKMQVFRRAGGRCEACRHRRAQDIHHVIKRSQGGDDNPEANLIALCRPCHRRTDFAYAAGRLVIWFVGPGMFGSRIVTKADKWAPDSA